MINLILNSLTLPFPVPFCLHCTEKYPKFRKNLSSLIPSLSPSRALSFLCQKQRFRFRFYRTKNREASRKVRTHTQSELQIICQLIIYIQSERRKKTLKK